MPLGAFDFSNSQQVWERIYNTAYQLHNRRVRLEPGLGALTIKALGFWGDMFSYPHIEFMAETEAEEPQALQDFIQHLFILKQRASAELRRYVLQLIYDDGFRQRFLDDPEEALKVAPLSAEEKDALRQASNTLQAAISDFDSSQLVNDADHIMLFPQSFDTIAPQAWFAAAWPFIEHFRSNFGLYLGAALHYSRVTIVGSASRDPAVTEEEEAFLKRRVGPLVERIAVTNADDLRQVLAWGIAHDRRFGLGGEVTEMIRTSRPDTEILAAIRHKLERDGSLAAAL